MSGGGAILRSSATAGLVLGAGALAQMAMMIVLGRVLPAEALGRFSLILSLASVISVAALLGQANALARLLSKHPPAQHRWKAGLRRAMAVSSGVAAALAVVTAVVYDLDRTSVAVLVAASAGLVVTQLFGSGVLRTVDRYFVGMLVLRGWPIGVLVALGLLWRAGALNATTAGLAFGGACLAVAALAAVAGLVGVAEGSKPLPGSLVRTGLLFWSISLCLIATRHLDRLLLGALLPLGTLGAYQAVLTIMMGFDLAGTALGFVLLPALTRAKIVRLTPYVALLLLVAAVGVAGYWLLGAPVLALAYDGAYDAHAPLIGWFIAAGVLKILYALPSALIGGRLPDTSLAQFALLNVPLVAAHAGVTAALAAQRGASGAAIGLACGWFLRLIAASVLVFLRRDHLGPAAGPSEVS